jgi:hypothetical protein
MSSKRLKARVPSAITIGTGVLQEHRLVFHKISKKDGSGKCDVIKSEPDDVIGVLFEIDRAEKSTLDKAEGLNNGYDEKAVKIKLESGATVSAITYFATNIDASLKPYTWYLRHVLEGAGEAQLPGDYVKSIMETPAIEDTDKKREADELAIYS